MSRELTYMWDPVQACRRQRIFATVGWLAVGVVVFAPDVVAARGATCVLKAPLQFSSKAKGAGRKLRLGPGATVEVSGHGQGWLQVRSGGTAGFAQAASIKRVCVARPAHPNETLEAMGDLPLEPLVPSLSTLPLAPLPGAGVGLASAEVSAPAPAPASQPPAPSAEPLGMAPDVAKSATSPAVGFPAVASPAVASVRASTAPPPSPMRDARTPAKLAGVQVLSDMPAPGDDRIPAPGTTPPDLALDLPAPASPMVRQVALWSAGSVGVLSLGGAAVAFFSNTNSADRLNKDIQAFNGQTYRDPGARNRLQQRIAGVATLDMWTLVAAGIGVTALGGAATLFFLGGPAEAAPADGGLDVSGPRVGLTIGPGAVGLSGAF